MRTHNMICFQCFAIAASLLSHPDAHDIHPAGKRSFRMLTRPITGAAASVFLEHLQRLDQVLGEVLQPTELFSQAEQLYFQGRVFFPDLGTQGEENSIEVGLIIEQLNHMRRNPIFLTKPELLHLLRDILRLLLNKFQQMERQFGVNFTEAKQRLQQTIQRIENL